MKWKYYSAGIIAPPGARGVVILNSSAGNQPSSKCMTLPIPESPMHR